MILRRLMTTTLGLGATVHGLALLRARQLQAQPDPVAYAQLSREPVGEERIVERPDGTRLRVVTDGSGPVVVLVHGYGVTLLEWNMAWSELRARGCRCVAFDMRGHGHSTIGSEGVNSAAMAADILAVFEALDLHDAVLVGHSTGGFLVIRALLDHPELSDRVRGFVAFASLAGEALRGSFTNHLTMPMIRYGIMQRVTSSPVYSWSFGAMFFGKQKPPSMIRTLVEMLAAQDHRALLPLSRALIHESYYDRLHEIAAPTVVVCGELDGTTPRWHAEQLGVRIPMARNIWVEGKGHILNWEAPEVLVAAIESLLLGPGEHEPAQP